MTRPSRGAWWMAAALVCGLAGCDESALSKALDPRTPTASIGGSRAAIAPDGESLPARSADTIRIASFNIQVFGESKLEKTDVVDVLAAVVRQFDVVAIQEIRAKSQDVLDRFLKVVNADGSEYDYLLGPRLGRTSSKEQYAFVYDTRRIEAARKAVYTIEDPYDVLHREPLVARFRARTSPPDQGFTFSLVNIHTDPDETDAELDVLDDAFRGVQNDGTGEDDVILLGDLNVSDRKLGELGRVPGITWTVTGQPTNTHGTASYDNILFDRTTTTEYTGRAGVFDLVAAFRLTPDQALDVSDHFPVWAEFSIREAPPARIADDPRATRRR